MLNVMKIPWETKKMSLFKCITPSHPSKTSSLIIIIYKPVVLGKIQNSTKTWLNSLDQRATITTTILLKSKTLMPHLSNSEEVPLCKLMVTESWICEPKIKWKVKKERLPWNSTQTMVCKVKISNHLGSMDCPLWIWIIWMLSLFRSIPTNNPVLKWAKGP